MDPILTLLADKQTNRAFSDAHPDSFCLMGVTLEDLYFDRSDLFVAGMAAGVNKVGVFSLYRYQANFVYSEEFWYVHSFDPFHPVDLNLASWQQCVSVSAHSSMNDIEIDIEPLQHAHTAFTTATEPIVMTTVKKQNINKKTSIADSTNASAVSVDRKLIIADLESRYLFQRRTCKLISHALAHLIGVIALIVII